MAYIHYCRNIIRQSFDRVLHHPTLFAGQGVRYRKLEVILTTTIDKLGKAGETVKVAPGHFRNHLMPKLLAVPNIDKFAHLISEQHKIYQPKEVEEVKVVHKTEEDITKEYQTAAKRLDNAKLKDSTRQVWIKVDGWDNLTANKQEARTYSKDISSYCGRLLEETEDELAELIKKGSVQVGYVSKVLCQDLSRHCSQKRHSGSSLAGNEDDDDEINSEL